MSQRIDDDSRLVSVTEPQEQDLPLTPENKRAYIQNLEWNLVLEEMIPLFEGNKTPEWQDENDFPSNVSEQLRDRFKREIQKLNELEPKLLRGESERRPQSLKDLFIIISTLDDQEKINEEINKTLQELEDYKVKAELKKEILRIRGLSNEEQFAEINTLVEKFSKAKMKQFRSDGMRNIVNLFNPFRVNKLMKSLIIGLNFLTNPSEKASLKESLDDKYETLLSVIRRGMSYLEEIKGVHISTVNDITLSNLIATIVQQLIAGSDEQLVGYRKTGFDIGHAIDTVESRIWGATEELA